MVGKTLARLLLIICHPLAWTKQYQQFKLIKKKKTFYCNKMIEAISYRNKIVVVINKNKFMYNFIATK